MGIHVNSCNTAIGKAHMSQYKYTHKYKPAKNYVLNDHIIKVNYSIAWTHYNYSEVLENTTNINPGSRSTSNMSSLSEKLSFVTRSNKWGNSKSTNSDETSIEKFQWHIFSKYVIF